MIIVHVQFITILIINIIIIIINIIIILIIIIIPETGAFPFPYLIYQGSLSASIGGPPQVFYFQATGSLRKGPGNPW